MIPILFCFPVFGSSPGYVCCLPTHILLQILSITLILILLPVLVLNTFDSSEINMGFWAMNLLIMGTLIFIILATYGVRKFSDGFITASFAVWVLTYTGFLMFSVYSVWNPMTLTQTSINGRCAMNLWLFDWCCRATGIICTNDDKLEKIRERFRGSIRIRRNSDDIWMDDELLNKLNKSDEFIVNDTQIGVNRSQNLTESFMENHVNRVNFTAENSFGKHNTSVVNQVFYDDQMFYDGISEVEHNREKRYVERGGPEYKKSVAALLGTLAIMMIFISLYTLYAVALNDVLTVLRYPFPVVFITRAAATDVQENGGTSRQQRSPEIVTGTS